MDLLSIGEVARMFDISARMLRYYDQVGLLPSGRKEDSAYRMYDQKAVDRLRQIITLRKLRIPVKQIAEILEDTERSKMLTVFQKAIDSVDCEITALKTIRDILQMFVDRLQNTANAQGKMDLLTDAQILDVVQTLSLTKQNWKERYSMHDLDHAEKIVSALKDARILYIPPFTVAASHAFGENPESVAGEQMDAFVKETALHKRKPDLRLFGFNNPCPQGDEPYGYEFWVTIPEDFSVPAPLQKKHFAGGLYAAHSIRMGDFHEWAWLEDWVKKSPAYDFEAREPFGMGGCLEEHLNCYSYYEQAGSAQITQLDLLTPIRAKASAQ